MSLQKFTSENRTTINWASGTSTEIYIYPPDASFSERNFLFRISSATVEAEESVFTFFKGITRHLMILKGHLELIHEGRYSKQLNPFDQDTFSGEWKTRSKGKVTDFNLMLKGGTTGSLKHQRIAADLSVSFDTKTDYHFIYFANGLALCNEISVQSGDLIQLDRNSVVKLHAHAVCDVIEIAVHFPE